MASNERDKSVLLEEHAGIIITALHKVVVKCTGRTRRQVIEGMTKPNFAISVLRLLTRIVQLQEQRLDTVGAVQGKQLNKYLIHWLQ